MSERSSFVTEYLYCDECFDKLKEALLREEEYLTGFVIEPFPIIAGKIGSLGPLGEFEVLFNIFGKYTTAPCHEIRLCILHDCGESSIVMVSPAGWVNIIHQFSREIKYPNMDWSPPTEG